MSNQEDKEISTDDNGTRAYSQWLEIAITAVNDDFTVNDVYLVWGKFYLPGNKNAEIKVASLNGTIVKNGETKTIASCGRKDTSSGTEGGLSLYDGKTLVFTYKWDCPWGKKTNTDSLIEKDKDRYFVDKRGGNYYGGALGNISINVTKKY